MIKGLYENYLSGVETLELKLILVVLKKPAVFVFTDSLFQPPVVGEGNLGHAYS